MSLGWKEPSNVPDKDLIAEQQRWLPDPLQCAGGQSNVMQRGYIVTLKMY